MTWNFSDMAWDINLYLPYPRTASEKLALP